MIFLGKVSFFHLYVIRAGGPIWVVCIGNRTGPSKIKD